MGEPLPGEQINVNVAVQWHDDGQVSLTLGPMMPEDVNHVLASVSTEDFQQQFVNKVRESFQGKGR